MKSEWWIACAFLLTAIFLPLDLAHPGVLEDMAYSKTVTAQFDRPIFKMYRANHTVGAVSPFTARVNEWALGVWERGPDSQLLPLRDEVGISVEYLPPDQWGSLADPVETRNYLGLRFSAVLEAPFHSLYAALTDYPRLHRIIPGMESSAQLYQDGNRRDVETVRNLSFPLLGEHRLRYRSSNLLFYNARRRTALIKSQLLPETYPRVSKNGRALSEGSIYADGFWYLEGLSNSRTRVTGMQFTLPRMDVDKAPPLLAPFKNQVRKEIMEGFVEGIGSYLVALQLSARVRRSQSSRWQKADKEAWDRQVKKLYNSFKSNKLVSIKIS